MRSAGRRRWPIVLLVLLLVLVGLFVAADRIALGLAEDKAATALQSSQNLPQKPDVSVEGFPFLTQLLAGNFGEVVVTADDVPALVEGAKFYSPAVGDAGWISMVSWSIELLRRNGPVVLVRPDAVAPQTRAVGLCAIGSGAAQWPGILAKSGRARTSDAEGLDGPTDK